jgi:uncharacterized phage-associated protein
MPLFPRHEPDLRSLIAYLVARAREKDITLTQTRLVKLLYLVDVERVASGRTPLTGLRWVFYHYGPYAPELPDTLERMEGHEVIAEGWQDSRLYRAAPGAPSGEDWVPGTRALVDTVIRRYAALDTNELLDLVYFHTAPMKDAVRGEALDMTRARTNPPPRTHPPLRAPALPDDARDRLRVWGEQRRREFVPVARDNQQPFFSDPTDEDIPFESTSGQLVVSPDADS